MAISIVDVESLLTARSLIYPSLDALNPNQQAYRSLLLQPSGPILADNSRIGPFDLTEANHQATKFLAIAKSKGHQLVVTPEYYLPTETLVASIQGDVFPASGSLWVLGCESIRPDQLSKLESSCYGYCDLIFVKEDGPEVQGVYYDPVAYCFTTKDMEGNDRKVVILQFKTISSRDLHFFENKNLRCGNVIYQFKGRDNLLSLSAIICSDSFNINLDDSVRRELVRNATLIHIQLNPKPRHTDYMRYRVDTFSKNKNLTNCDIICLNWAEDMIQFNTPYGKPDEWNNESASAWYISEDRCSSHDYEIEHNESLGLYYSKHIRKRHVLHFHGEEAVFELTVAKILHDGDGVLDNNTGPKLDVRYTWDQDQLDWVPNELCPDCGLDALCSLNPGVKSAVSALKSQNSRLQMERAIALSKGIESSKQTWFNASQLDSCKLNEDEIVNRATLRLDRNKQAHKKRVESMNTLAQLSNILNTQNLPRQIHDLNGGDITILWKANSPHVNIYKDGCHPALVSFLGVEPEEALKRNIVDASYELLRVENNLNHKDRVAVCYQTTDFRIEFVPIPQLTNITHGGGSATHITEG